MISAHSSGGAPPAVDPGGVSTTEVADLLQVVRKLEAECAGALHLLGRLERRFAPDRTAGEKVVGEPDDAAGQVPGANAAAGSHVLRLQVLGRFRAWIDGHPIELWHSARARTLLKCLAVHRNRRVPRDQLIETLWPDADPRAGANSLRVTVHALRRLLAEATGSTSSDDFVLCEHNSYAFGPALAVEVDVAAFEQLWRRGRLLEQRGARAEALHAFEAAESLYQGDFLQDDPYDEWTILRREALRDCYLALVARLGRHALDAGDYEGCIQRSHTILAQDPCREDVYQWLMQCYAALGQPGRVRRWFDVCSGILRQELDLPPGPETVALLHALQETPSRA